MNQGGTGHACVAVAVFCPPPLAHLDHSGAWVLDVRTLLWTMGCVLQALWCRAQWVLSTRTTGQVRRCCASCGRRDHTRPFVLHVLCVCMCDLVFVFALVGHGRWLPWQTSPSASKQQVEPGGTRPRLCVWLTARVSGEIKVRRPGTAASPVTQRVHCATMDQSSTQTTGAVVDRGPGKLRALRYDDTPMSA